MRVKGVVTLQYRIKTEEKFINVAAMVVANIPSIHPPVSTKINLPKTLSLNETYQHLARRGHFHFDDCTWFHMWFSFSFSNIQMGSSRLLPDRLNTSVLQVLSQNFRRPYTDAWVLTGPRKTNKHWNIA